MPIVTSLTPAGTWSGVYGSTRDANAPPSSTSPLSSHVSPSAVLIHVCSVSGSRFASRNATAISGQVTHGLYSSEMWKLAMPLNGREARQSPAASISGLSASVSSAPQC